MAEYCRLCAELKDHSDIVTSINDTEQSMEQKLWACCQWTIENTEHRLPHSVCSDCLDKLDKCWLFSQSVQLAQQRLLGLFVNETNPLFAVIIPPPYDNPLTYLHNNSTPETIPLKISTPEYYYSEYHPTDHHHHANGQPRQYNDLSDDHTYSEYFEENKIDIIPIQTNELLKIAQVENYRDMHEHKCTHCGQQFASKSNLKRHRSIHTGLQPYECWLCHKMFRLKFNLSKHMLMHTNTQNTKTDAKLRYGISNRWRRASSRKNPKVNTNPREYRFSCDKCGHKFTRKSQLVKHSMMHIKPYQCDCGLRFKYESNLLSHQKRLNHSNDGQELLDVENSLDSKLSALFSTILTGKDVEINEKPSIGILSNGSGQCPRPFRCDACDKEFTLRRGLLQHRRMVHTLENPIECEHCGKFYKHGHSLRRHLQLFSIEYPLVNDTNRYSCEDCGRTFVRKLWLLKHRQSHLHTVPEDSNQTTVKIEYNPEEHLLKQTNELYESIESQFECWLCHEMFASTSLLEKHFAIHMLSPGIRRLQTELIYHHC